MAHPEQHNFFLKVREKFPNKFKNVNVLDFGSLDVNGSLKDLFEDSKYIGIDIHEGKNVDVISKAHEFKIDTLADTVVSGEMLEHDEYWMESLLNMYNCLKEGGLMVVSAAGDNRLEHGTGNAGDPWIWGTSPNYYKNITFQMICEFCQKISVSEFYFEYGVGKFDVYFYLIK